MDPRRGPRAWAQTVSSLVETATLVYHRGHRDASLSYGPKVERTLLRETFTDESDAVQETRRLAFDLAAYMAAQGVTRRGGPPSSC